MSEAARKYTKPLPELDGFAKEFYEFCKNGELRFQRCNDCHAWRHMPREMCAKCGSWEWGWRKSSGRGEIFTWTVVNRALHPAFRDATPLAPVVIEMEEGVRLLSEVQGVAPENLEVGMRVQVVFDAVTDEVTLPKFRRV